MQQSKEYNFKWLCNTIARTLWETIWLISLASSLYPPHLVNYPPPSSITPSTPPQVSYEGGGGGELLSPGGGVAAGGTQHPYMGTGGGYSTALDPVSLTTSSGLVGVWRGCRGDGVEVLCWKVLVYGLWRRCRVMEGSVRWCGGSGV